LLDQGAGVIDIFGNQSSGNLDMLDDFRRDSPEQGSSNRAFGLIFSAIFLLIAISPLFVGRSVHTWSLLAAGIFGAAALMMPAVLAPLNRLWTRFGLLLHRVVSPLVLGIMFFLVITPMGLVMRMLGKDPLRLRRDPGAPTYWIERKPPGPPPETFVDQF
jgi:Saxitoxin biosynthesis operon protein SxtJ